MKIIGKLIIILFLFVGLIANSTNYYVKSTGNDNNTGLSDAQAWRTLAKINERTFAAGDNIHFNRGDSWVGTLVVPSSGTSTSRITLKAYGTGADPVITGSEVVTGWTLHSGNIYKATVDKTDISQLFLDGERMLLARYPDAGYHTVTTVNNTTTFVSTDLNGATNYIGATWIGRTSRFNMYHRTVTAQTSQTLTLVSAPGAALGVGEGFFLCNKLAFLTQAGEWYYDNAANLLYFWTPTGASPAGYEVRVSTANYGISITDKSYITIENIELLQSAEAGVKIINGDYITIDSCNIVNPDVFGIYVPLDNSAFVSSNLTVTNTQITSANGNGIRSFSNDATFTGNTISNTTGLLENINKVVVSGAFTGFAGFDGYGNTGSGIFHIGNSSVYQYNNIINSGYNGINFRGTNSIVKYNFVDSACMVLDDGGGIYTYNITVPTSSSGSKIMYNIVKNVFGNFTGLSVNVAWYKAGYGIYLDSRTASVHVLNNTVFSCGGGVYLHDNNGALVQYNTFFDVMLGILVDGEYGGSSVYDNIVYGTDRIATHKWWKIASYQRLMGRQSSPNAKYNRNTYVHHYQTSVFHSGSAITFAAWKSATAQDVNSTFDGSVFTTQEDTIFYNATSDTITWNRNAATAYKIDGTTIDTVFTILPWESLITTGSSLALITEEGALPPGPPPPVDPPDPEEPVVIPNTPIKINGRMVGSGRTPFGIYR